MSKLRLAYEVIMEQITLDMYKMSLQEPEYGERGCHVCFWHNYDKRDEGCHWMSKLWRSPDNPMEKFPNCRFMPRPKFFHMCANCEYGNPFVHKHKPEYEERIKQSWCNYCPESNKDPLEEPNIYCTHPEGSLNRRTAYKDREYPTGIGHWDCQHEWDTCDRWEPRRRRY